MSMIDPKGSRQEAEAMAIIRAHRAQNRPQEASLAPNVKSPATIMLPIPGFWKSLASHIQPLSPENKPQRERDPMASSVQLILP